MFRVCMGTTSHRHVQNTYSGQLTQCSFKYTYHFLSKVWREFFQSRYYMIVLKYLVKVSRGIACRRTTKNYEQYGSIDPTVLLVLNVNTSNYSLTRHHWNKIHFYSCVSSASLGMCNTLACLQYCALCNITYYSVINYCTTITLLNFRLMQKLFHGSILLYYYCSSVHNFCLLLSQYKTKIFNNVETALFCYFYFTFICL